jgi:tetratricopeptide (TPR) repeat protein
MQKGNDMKMNSLVAVFLIFLFYCGSANIAGADRKKAVELNTLGYKYYSEKKYYDAIEQFREAINQDKTYVFPHYNLACTIALVFTNDDFSEFKKRNRYFGQNHMIGLIDEAIDNLKIAIAIDPKYKEKARHDSDLNYMRTEATFFNTLDYDLNNPDDVKEILWGITHWGIRATPNSEQDPSWIRFYKDGTLVFNNLYWETGNDFSNEIKGTYLVSNENGKVKIQLILEKEKLGTTKFAATLQKDKEKYLLYVDSITRDERFLNDPFYPFEMTP